MKFTELESFIPSQYAPSLQDRYAPRKSLFEMLTTGIKNYLLHTLVNLGLIDPLYRVCEKVYIIKIEYSRGAKKISRIPNKCRI